MASDLSHQLQLLITPTYNPDISVYISLLRKSVELKEFRTAVFIFDQIKSRGWTPTEEVYQILEELHSKTLPESNKVKVPIVNPGAKTLAPRRRIHKIIKGWRMKQTNQISIQYLPKAKGLLECRPDYKRLPRIELAKKIANGCHLDFETSRRIVTKLKQTGYLPKDIAAPKVSSFNWTGCIDSVKDHNKGGLDSNKVKPELPKSGLDHLNQPSVRLVQSSLDKYLAHAS